MTRRLLAIAALALLVPRGARPNGPPDGPPVPGDPHGGHPTWLTTHPQDQADRDGQVPPAATGAIFVPAMTDQLVEPGYIVRTPDGEEVAAAPAGRKTWLAPGTYRVLVGSGVPEHMLEFEVAVVDGRTTFVPVEWSGLVVNVVSERGTPFRGSYELVRLPAREYVGLGLGADIASGETLKTWILRPGKYMVLSAGESYRARKNFATLRLPPAQLVSYTLVLDEATGDLLGAGEVDTEVTSASRGPWSLSILLGGSVQLNRADNVVGKHDGTSLDASAYLETVGGFRDPSHVAYARLYVEEEGTIRFPDEPYLRLVDEVDFDLLYMYRVVPWFGPYGRFSLETHFVPGFAFFDKPTDVRRVDTEGGTIGIETARTEVELSPPLSPVDLRYGLGGRFDIAPVYWVSLSSRLGAGGRHVFANGLFVAHDDPSTGPLDIREIADVTQFGAEGSLIGELRMTRWVQLKLELDVLLPFEDPENPVLDFRGQVALRLASFASLNYTVRIKQDVALTAETQIDQALLLRLAYKIL